MLNPLLGLILLSLINSALSLIKINNQDYLIIQWSNNGPLTTNLTQVVLYPTNANISGRIVMVPAPVYNAPHFMEAYLKILRDLVNRGCVGIISTNYNRVLPGSYVYGTIGGNFPVPVGVVSWNLRLFLLSQPNKTASIQFIDWDPNPFDATHTGATYAIITAIVVLMFVTNTIFAGYRIFMWIYTLRERFEFNIGFGCLATEFICNFIRSFSYLYWTLHNNYAVPFIDLLTTVPLCITLITSILIVFFWLDLTSDPFYQGKFLGAMKKPAIVMVTIIVTFEIAFDCIRCLTTTDYNLYQMAIYVALHFIVVAFNIIAGFRILFTLNEQSDGKKKLKKVIHRIIYSGIISIIGIIVWGLLMTPLYGDIYSSVIVYLLLFSSFWLQSLLLIMIFKIPKHRECSSTTNSKTSELTTSTPTKEIAE